MNDGQSSRGNKGDASTRKRWLERVTTVDGSMRSPGSGADGSDDAGATGCGGRTDK